MSTIEQKLLNNLLNHDFYQRTKHILRPETFGGSLKPVYDALEKAHAEHKTDLSVDELRELCLVSEPFSKARRNQLNGLFDAIEMEQPATESVATAILKSYWAKQLATKITEEVLPIVNGETLSFNAVRELLENEELPDLESRFSAIEMSIKDLMEQSDPSKRFPFRLGPLQQHVEGAGRGHNMLVFARPEIGKSSLVADMCVGFADHGLKIAYFANEEPEYKIMLNLVRAKLELTDLELRANYEAGTSTYKALDNLCKNFSLFDAVGMDIFDIHEYARSAEPDVIVLDQTDKLLLPGRHESRHELLKNLYVHTREISKRNNLLMVNVSQASADAENKRYVTFDMLEYSKTGKAGEVDLAIGIGRNVSIDEDYLRILFVSKNKINGWHGPITVTFNPYNNKWSE